ncbi:hypothetical protein ACWD6R_16495 [Streptomyces sp. NPDC005151]
MGHLPTLRRDHPDRIVLDSHQQVTTVLIDLAGAWRRDPDAIGGLLSQLIEHDDLVRDEVEPERLGDIEHARDQIADQLLTEAGGAEFHLSPRRDRHAAHQARRIAEEARRMADVLDAHANAIAIEVDDADRAQFYRAQAEIQRLRAQLKEARTNATTPQSA